MSSHIHETKSPATRKPQPAESSSTAEERKSPTADQLWNAIEFSRQFPELTLCLVAELKISEQVSNNRIEVSTPAEPLEFPSLIASDPREFRAHGKKPEEEVEQEIALFAAGKLLPPEPELPVPPKKEKAQLWRYLLSFFAMLFLLLWMHDGWQTQEVRHLQLQASK
ncbi:hypothetical protein [Candidatus Electronema sp. PJ]|uniref:hypothetical protein n=1 Tax=Candidatus Electronema sp. PJ TaxID=3401572 RepID=UPI003AA8CBF1